MSSTVCKIASLALLLAACGGSDKGAVADPADPSASGAEGTETEPSDGLAVSGTKGRLESEQISAGITPHVAALEGCYKTELKAKKFLTGKVLIDVVVAPTGQVGSAAIIDSDVGDWAVERCLLGVTRQMAFAKPVGGNGEASFQFPVNFTSDQTALETWPEHQLASVLAEKRPALDACGAGPEGAKATVYIGTGGAVQSVGFAAGTPLDDAWADCVAREVSSWTFADPQGKIVKAAFVLWPAAPVQKP